jgi:iron complex outermembrane receptor protein
VQGNATFTSSVLFAGTSLDDPLLEMGLGTTAVETPGQRLEQAGRFTQSLSSWLLLEEHVSVSYEGIERREEVEGRTDVALSASRLGTRLGLGAELTPLAGASANVRASLQCLDTSETSLDFCTQVVPGARTGALWQKGAFSTYANVAQAARPPTLSELYGVSLLMRGNEALEPESATTIEAGARQHFPRRGAPRLWLDASAFARFAQDLIVFTRTAQGFLRPENRDQTRTLGAEFLVGTEPLPGLRIEGNVSLLDPRDTTPDRRTQNDILPFVSRFVASASAEQRFLFATEALRLLRLALRTHYESSRYADSAGLAVVPEQSSTDLELGSGWFLGSSAPNASTSTPGKSPAHLLSVEFRISNLFDQRRYDIVGFPLPGRAWFTSLALDLP